jgi:hypothetical protein
MGQVIRMDRCQDVIGVCHREPVARVVYSVGARRVVERRMCPIDLGRFMLRTGRRLKAEGQLIVERIEAR